MDGRLLLARLRRLDWALMAVTLVLVGLGFLFIYSAGYRGQDEEVPLNYLRQMRWAALGLAGCLAVAALDYERIVRSGYWIYAASVFLLVLVYLFGHEINGARRWIKLPGFLLQPSELAKPAVVILLARFLGRPGRDLSDPRCLLHIGLLVGLPFLLIMKQPDLGTAMVLLPVTLAMMFVAGVPPKTLLILGGVGLLLLPVGWFALDDYQRDRLLVFFDPGRDPLGAGWNKIQSEIAVGSGGLVGKGLLKGTQNILGYLPRTVAPTDFIFSVIAEETGFVGTSLILGLFAGLLLAGLRVALRARDRYGMLLAVGVATMIFSHALVNIAMTIGLMPITGLPLPLLSYGGSFMLTIMLSLGLVHSVYIRRKRH